MHAKNALESPYLVQALEFSLNTLTYELSESCYSRAVPGRPARGPHQVRGNLHSIARIEVEMTT